MAGRFLLDGEVRPYEYTVQRKSLFIFVFGTSVETQIETIDRLIKKGGFLSLTPDFSKIKFIGRAQKRGTQGIMHIYEFIVDGIYYDDTEEG